MTRRHQRRVSQARQNLRAAQAASAATATADAGLFADWPDSEPRTDPGSLDLEALMRVLRRVEADGHRRGWDRTPLSLFAVYERADEETHHRMHKVCGNNPGNLAAARVGPYVAQFLFPAQVFTGGDGGILPYEGLAAFAFNIAYCPQGVPQYPGVNMVRHLLRSPGVVAVGVTYEAWQRALTPEQMRDEAVTPPDYSTMPGAVETRIVMAVDLSCRVHTVSRTRGDRPVTVGDYQMLVPGGNTEAQERTDGGDRGDQSNSLRMLADMIMGRTPRDQQGFDDRYYGIRRSADLADVADARAQG
jgi:hypothetical protein